MSSLDKLRKEIADAKKNHIISMRVAVEFGYREREKGESLDSALARYDEIVAESKSHSYRGAFDAIYAGRCVAPLIDQGGKR